MVCVGRARPARVPSHREPLPVRPRHLTPGTLPRTATRDFSEFFDSRPASLRMTGRSGCWAFHTNKSKGLPMLPQHIRNRVLHRAASPVRPSIESLEQRTLLAVGTNHWPVGTETLVNAYTTGTQWRPTVAMSAIGEFVVTWESQTQLGFWNVWAQRFNSAGVKQGGEIFVSSNQVTEQRSNSIGMDAAGNFVVAWHTPYQDPFIVGVHGLEIYARRFNAAGVPQGSDIHVNTYTTGYHEDPSIGVNSDGSFAVRWSGDGPNGSNTYAQRYNAAGVPQGGQVLATGNEIPSEIDSDGNYITAST